MQLLSLLGQKKVIRLWNQRNHIRVLGTFSFTPLTHCPSQSMASCSHSSHYKVIQSFINGLCSCTDMETILMINLKLSIVRSLRALWDVRDRQCCFFSQRHVFNPLCLMWDIEAHTMKHSVWVNSFIDGARQTFIKIFKLNWSETISSIHKNAKQWIETDVLSKPSDAWGPLLQLHLSVDPNCSTLIK